MLEYDDFVVAMNEIIKKCKFPIYEYKIVKKIELEAFLDNTNDLEDNITNDIFRRLHIEVNNLDIKTILCELIRPKLSFKVGRHIEDDKYEIIADYNTNYTEIDTKLIKEFIDEYNG